MNAVLDAVLQILAALLLLVGSYAIARLAAWLKLGADDKARAYLNQALERGVDLALHELRGKLPIYANVTPTPTELSTVINRVSDYTRDSVSDALKRLGVQDARLPDMAAARVAARLASFHAAG